MFKALWARRATNGRAREKALKDELARVERLIEDTVQQIVDTSVPAALRVLEEKTGKLLICKKMGTATMLQGT